MYSWNDTDNDWWDKGKFKTIEECIKEAVERYGKNPGDVIEVGIVYPYKPNIDIEDMLERLEEQAYEECGEAAESWDISDKKWKQEQGELHEDVQALVEKYLEKIREKPNFYKVSNVRTVKVKTAY